MPPAASLVGRSASSIDSQRRAQRRDGAHQGSGIESCPEFNGPAAATILSHSPDPPQQAVAGGIPALHGVHHGFSPTEKLSRLVKEVRGQARITEGNVSDMLREVRMALLEADVALPVVRDFIARVKDKALGAEVVGSLTPARCWSASSRRAAATMGEGCPT